jgi:hypothetical protein
MSMTGGSAGDGTGGGFHTGSLNPGTGGVRDTYDPDEGAAWSQAEYAERIQGEVNRPRKPLLKRMYLAARRLIQGY